MLREDENDYDQNSFLKDENGKQYQFDTKDEAVKWLNDNIKYEKIDSKYRIIDKDPIFREKYFK